MGQEQKIDGNPREMERRGKYIRERMVYSDLMPHQNQKVYDIILGYYAVDAYGAVMGGTLAKKSTTALKEKIES